jgi:precorrin-6B methylase 2
VSELLLGDAVPAAQRPLEPEMVPYQPTPVRVVLALLAHARVTSDDVFFDVGCGLGQVPMLANLLTGATAVGVEYEPAYCEYARRRVIDLNLNDVSLRNEDACAANYSDGTVFFLYTPARGAMLDAVLERIRIQTLGREIRVLTYGPCTETVASLPWLASTGKIVSGPESAGAFVTKYATLRRR